MNGSKIKATLRFVLALLFIAAGTLHFTYTRFYLAIMPPFLPFPRALVFVSGFFEILGGAALLIPALTGVAGYCLIALLLAVFPANIYMAVRDIEGDGNVLLLLWLRLPLQFVLIALVWWCTRECFKRRCKNEDVRTDC